VSTLLTDMLCRSQRSQNVLPCRFVFEFLEARVTKRFGANTRWCAFNLLSARIMGRYHEYVKLKGRIACVSADPLRSGQSEGMAPIVTWVGLLEPGYPGEIDSSS
jgi:hypothetical protein